MTTDRRSSPLAALVAVAAILLPAGYVLSVGPANWLYNHGYLSNAAGVIYDPLAYLHEHYKPIRDALDWYIELWR